MAFWSDIYNDQDKNVREPLRQNRWFLDIPLLDSKNDSGQSSGNNSELYYALKDCQKPSYSLKTTQHILMNQAFNYPTILIWKPIQAKILSTVGSTPTFFTSQRFYNYNNSHVSGNYTEELTSYTNYKSYNTSKKDLIQEINLWQVDENGIVIEKWKLNGAFISDVNFGSLSYSNDELVEISFTINYDNAILFTSGFENGYEDQVKTKKNTNFTYVTGYRQAGDAAQPQGGVAIPIDQNQRPKNIKIGGVEQKAAGIGTGYDLMKDKADDGDIGVKRIKRNTTKSKS